MADQENDIDAELAEEQLRIDASHASDEQLGEWIEREIEVGEVLKRRAAREAHEEREVIRALDETDAEPVDFAGMSDEEFFAETSKW